MKYKYFLSKNYYMEFNISHEKAEKSGIVPFYKMGKSVYYNLSKGDIKKLIELGVKG